MQNFFTGAGVRRPVYGANFTIAATAAEWALVDIQAPNKSVQLLFAHQLTADENLHIEVLTASRITTVDDTLTDAELAALGELGVTRDSVFRLGSSTTDPDATDQGFHSYTLDNAMRLNYLQSFPVVAGPGEFLTIQHRTVNVPVTLHVLWAEF